MRLLFDQNVSYKIVNKIIDEFPDCKHVSQVGLINCDDTDIWVYAHDNNFVIVTFDSDFFDISLLSGCPPKVIWIRTGNLSTNEIIELLKINKEIIIQFATSQEMKEMACLELY